MVALLSTGCGAVGSDAAPGRDLRGATIDEKIDESFAAGQALCSRLSEHVSAVGSTFNDAAADVAGIADPEERRIRWFTALDTMLDLNAGLRTDIDEISYDILEQIRRDIAVGIDGAVFELEDIRRTILDSLELDEERHQIRTQQIIVRIEKVIDLVKPEMADYDDPNLIALWGTIPTCRHAVKDVYG